MEEPLIVNYEDIKVYYTPDLDGGGRTFGQDYVPVIKKHFGKVGRCCEFGSGPGFIGFSLLAHGLCESLCLTDINPDAIAVVKKTIKENKLQGKVSAYVSDVFKSIPKKEKWDLVVSNPPHFESTEKEYDEDKRLYDPGWRIHKEFYNNVSKFLTRNGSTLFVENALGSKPEIWERMIKESGLSYKGYYRHKTVSPLIFPSNPKNALKKSTNTVLKKYLAKPQYFLYYPYYFVEARKIQV